MFLAINQTDRKKDAISKMAQMETKIKTDARIKETQEL
jgi:hypothetical protein